MMSCCGGKARKPAASPQIHELWLKNTEPSQNNSKQELWWAKKDPRINRRVVLQALKRRKSSQKHLQPLSCAFKTMRSAQEHVELITKMNDLINDSMKTEDAVHDASDGLFSSGNEEEFDENLLLAELEKLEKNLDENQFEADRKEDQEFLAASPSHHAKLEEEEEEEDIEEHLEYLRQWASSL